MAETEQQRTKSQNKAIHLWFTQITQTLNDSGYTLHDLLRAFNSVSVDVTENSVKSVMQAIAEVQYGKSHTSELTTLECTRVAEEMNRILGQGLGVHVPFPSHDTKNLIDTYNV
jgi:hypothetical protein